MKVPDEHAYSPITSNIRASNFIGISLTDWLIIGGRRFDREGSGYSTLLGDVSAVVVGSGAYEDLEIDVSGVSYVVREAY